MRRVSVAALGLALVCAACGTLRVGKVDPAKPHVEYDVSVALAGTINMPPISLGRIQMQAGTVQSLVALGLAIASSYVTTQYAWDRCEVASQGQVTPIETPGPVSTMVRPGTVYSVVGLLRCFPREGDHFVYETVSVSLREVTHPGLPMPPVAPAPAVPAPPDLL